MKKKKKRPKTITKFNKSQNRKLTTKQHKLQKSKTGYVLMYTGWVI